ELKVGPYKDFGKITITDVFKKYWILILINFATLVVLGWFLARHTILNRKIKTAHKELELEVNERIQAEELFRKERDNALEYLNIVGVMIVVLNSDQSIAVINKKGCEILGYDESEVIGKKWLDNFIPEREKERTRTIFFELMAGNIEPVKYYENYILTKDNKERLIAWHNSVLRDDEGKIVATLSSGEDVTERTQLETELQLKSLVFETALTANSAADNKGILTHVNKAFIKTWGYENKEEAVGKSISELLKFEDEAKKIITTLDEVGKWEGEYTALKKDGTTFVAYGLATSIKNELGNVIGYQSAVLDISEQKLAEEALTESEERYRALFDRSLELVYLCDFEGNFIDANDAALEAFGYTKKDIKALNFLSLLDKDQLPRALETVEEILKTGSQKEIVAYNLRKRDGEYIYVETKGALIYRDGKPFAIQGIARNITDRRLAEDALRKNEKKYRSIFENAVEGFFQSTPEGRFTSVNPTFARMLGYASPEELISKITDISEQYYLNPEDRLRYEHLLKKDGSVEHFEFKALRKDGSQIWVSNSTRAIYDSNGKIVLYEGNVNNITLRKQAEEALQESETKYRSMMEAMKDPIYICSSDYHVEYMNPSMIRSLGRDATGDKCFKAIHNLDEICPWCMHSKIYKNECFEYDIVSPRNNRHYQITNSAIIHKDGSISKMTVFRDTTDFTKMKEELQQAQKMEAIGTLAGGIAHDFNNLLTTIIGNAQLALMDISKDDSLRKQIEEIKKAGQRSASLTRQLLAFSRKQVIKPEVLDINNVINE
ncbi:MAG: PAS domain S-box protein, partial [Thermodesulfobacteriota bacterium]|nr:PAS domain S-box protein [Thermodesulfobacteriota bacterium]